MASVRARFLMPRRIADHGDMACLRSNHLSNSTAPITNNHNRRRFTTCFTTILQKWRIFRFRHLCKYCSLTYQRALIVSVFCCFSNNQIVLISMKKLFCCCCFFLLCVSVFHMCYHSRTYSIQSFFVFCHLVNNKNLILDFRFGYIK